PGGRARHLVAERDATRAELSQHLLEVAELLAGELRERHRQLPPLGILEEEAHRGGRRLLLAVGVVEEDLVEVRARTLDPRATRGGREAQHGALLPRRRRPPKRRAATRALSAGRGGLLAALEPRREPFLAPAGVTAADAPHAGAPHDGVERPVGRRVPGVRGPRGGGEAARAGGPGA